MKIKKTIGIFFMVIILFLSNNFILNKYSSKKIKKLTVGAWIRPLYNSNVGKEQIILAKWGLNKNYFHKLDSYSYLNLKDFNNKLMGAFAGGVFDGRYLYLLPLGIKRNYSGEIARFDTFNNFNSQDAWSFFDISKLSKEYKGFTGGVFDGKYVYLIPNFGDGFYSGLVARYDTSSPFHLSSSWSFFDISKLNHNAKGFMGGVFDGKYVYLIPHRSSKGVYSGLVARYDTSSPFHLSSSWSFFDLKLLNHLAVGFAGGIFDGRYIYIVPNRKNDVEFSGLVARYDTSSPFHLSSSWSFFDISKLNHNAKGFMGGVFDGKYVYFSPFILDLNNYSGLVARYNTLLPFASSKAWELVELSSLINEKAKGFAGALFDGYYIYLIPFRYNLIDQEDINYFKENNNDRYSFTTGFNSLLVRFNTQKSFTSHSSWEYFDLIKINKNLKGFWGGLLVERTIYLIPQKTSGFNPSATVVRFRSVDNNRSIFRLTYSQINQSGSFSSGPIGPNFEINLNGNIYSVHYPKKLNKNRWYFIAGVFDGKSIKLYIDGDLISQELTGSDLFIYNKQDQLDLKNVSSNLKGEIKHRMITFKALSLDELKKIQKLTFPGKE